MIDIVLETGKTWTFASALGWPGWCRRAKGEEAALEELLAYADRYAVVAGELPRGKLRVIARVPGNVTTDFGAPDVSGDWEDGRVSEHELELLERCWAGFDNAVASASEQLRKGPRGGGRDRDKIVEHVREAERGYGRQVGLRLPPRTPWPEQREALVAALRQAEGTKWRPRYAVRRIAWHVLDHAWELEDKTL